MHCLHYFRSTNKENLFLSAVIQLTYELAKCYRTLLLMQYELLLFKTAENVICTPKSATHRSALCSSLRVSFNGLITVVRGVESLAALGHVRSILDNNTTKYRLLEKSSCVTIMRVIPTKPILLY